MQPTARLPRPATLLTAAGVVTLALVLWGTVSLVRGTLIRPLEAVMFALVFALVYFGGLSLVSSESDTDTDGESN